jgi:hypothetical protein
LLFFGQFLDDEFEVGVGWLDDSSGVEPVICGVVFVVGEVELCGEAFVSCCGDFEVEVSASEFVFADLVVSGHDGFEVESFGSADPFSSELESFVVVVALFVGLPEIDGGVRDDFAVGIVDLDVEGEGGILGELCDFGCAFFVERTFDIYRSGLSDTVLADLILCVKHKISLVERL